MRLFWLLLRALVERGDQPTDSTIDTLIKPVTYRPGFERYDERLQIAGASRRKVADSIRKDANQMASRDDRRSRIQVAS